MPNRIIKETITTSCEIDHLTADEERFFYRLMVSCDDFGRMDARTAVLRAKCFPLKVDSIKNADIEKWLKKLVKVNLITLYEAEGKPYLFMTKWDKHQQRRAKHSKYPAPDEGMISDDINGNHLQEHVPEESRNRGTEESRNENPDQGGDSYSKEFETFWNIYPRKSEKKAAYAKYKASKNKGATVNQLLQAATNYALQCKRETTDEKYIKLPATFLGPNEHWREWATREPPQPRKVLTSEDVERKRQEKLKALEG
jgi:predicted RNA-binding protein with RPS1 domain